LNSNGQTAFFATLTGANVDATNDRGIWSDGGGNGLKLVVRDGVPAPGAEPGVEFSLINSTLSGPRINDSGKIAFHSGLQGSGVVATNNAGIWSDGKGNSLELVALEGNAAPGASAKFGSLLDPFSGIALNNNGQTAFLASLTGPGVNNTNDLSIWSEGRGNGLELVAREGNLAPGTSANFSDFVIIGAPSLNDFGQLAFLAELTGPGVDNTNERGIWRDAGGNGLQLVARNGDPAPGTSDRFFGHVNSPQISSQGHLVFTSTLVGADLIDSSTHESIWRVDSSNGLELVIQTGAPAPGTDANFSRVYGPGLNSNGQIAFAGILTGDGINNSNRFGFWAEDKSGLVRLIVRLGDTINISDNPSAPDFREIALLVLNGTLNDRGEAYFFARFTDGSEGVFVSNAATIPEPKTLALLCMVSFLPIAVRVARMIRRSGGRGISPCSPPGANRGVIPAARARGY
jgi:hypothetical protein